MPPKKATTSASAAPTRTPSARATVAKAAGTKRKAAEDSEESAPKRSKSTAEAPKAKAAAAKKVAPKAATKAASSKSAQSTAKKPAAKAATKSTTEKAAPKAAAKAAPKSATSSKSKATTKATAMAAENDDGVSEKEAAPKANTSAKRKASNDDVAPAAKKSKTTAAGKAINQPPTETLEVYVCGEGDSGELGLGTEKRAKGVKRPRLNHFLDADKVGVVQVAAGGMHAAALTRDNTILTWGVNDQGACGRDTAWDGGLRDMDAPEPDSDSEAENEKNDNGLNPKEATPMAVPAESFPEHVKFVQVVAGDSATFALTTDGYVYGWGTFRDNNGVLGFTKDTNEQRTPALIEGVKNITQLAMGANHVLALDKNGNVFAWGTGQQNQLGRRIVERTRINGLTPREFGLPKKQIKYVAAGSDHSFAIDKKNNVWAWGLNNFGQCGLPENAGGDDAVIPVPQKVASLGNYTMTCLKGGAHHSVGVSDNGECLVWGRTDAGQMGIDLADFPADSVIKDGHGTPRILKVPTPIPGLTAKFATAESDHSIVITTDGQAYSFGLSTTYQTGQGSDEDISVATLIDNTAVRGKKLNWAGAGGQYSILTAPAHPEQQQSNGSDKPAESVSTSSKQTGAADSKDKAVNPKEPAGSSKGKKLANGAAESASSSTQAASKETKDTATESKNAAEASTGKMQANGVGESASASSKKAASTESKEKAAEPKEGAVASKGKEQGSGSAEPSTAPSKKTASTEAKEKATKSKEAGGSSKGKKESNGSAEGKKGKENELQLEDALAKVPGNMQGFVKEQVSKGATVTEEEDGIHVERETTPEIEMTSSKYGKI